MSERIDQLIATEIMGWKSKGLIYEVTVTSDGRPVFIEKHKWVPSKDIRQAWDIVDKLKISITPQEGAPENMRYQALIENQPHGTNHEDFSKTATLAICRVALKSKGVNLPHD